MTGQVKVKTPQNMKSPNTKLSIIIEASKELIDTTYDEKDIKETQKENNPDNI